MDTALNDGDAGLVQPLTVGLFREQRRERGFDMGVISVEPIFLLGSEQRHQNRRRVDGT